MSQLQKYTWLIETIRRAGRISHRDLSDRWERNINLSEGLPLPRATFNRWRDAIFAQFNIIIDCQRKGGYLYYIDNPEDIDEDRLKKWMLDSMAVGNIIGENIGMKNRILVDEIPSGRDHLTTVIEAMKANRTVRITYRPFTKGRAFTFPVKPYCVKLFENRWYIVAHNDRFDDIRVYGLDRVESVEVLNETFALPPEFDAEAIFATAYGIVIDKREKPVRVVIRATDEHTPYLKTLPLHRSQKLVGEGDDYADFELFVAPTYDFVMKLLQAGPMVEVLEPAELRRTMKGWIADMAELYKND